VLTLKNTTAYRLDMPPGPVVIRLPRTSYLAVVFLLIASLVVAFGDNHPHGLEDSTAATGFTGFHIGPQAIVLLIPIFAAAFIARTATLVSTDGLRVRALFGTRDLPWDSVRGLSVSGRGVYAVMDDGAVRLPCVRIAHLGPMSRLSGGRLPEMADATPKPAPSPHRRRR
jgi:Bacterial PH domain